MPSLPAPIQALLALFQGPLASVRFADVDAAALKQLASEIDSATVEAEEQESRLAELRQALAQQHEAMLLLAQRAHAYARVYAEGDEALTQELNRISLARPSKPRKLGGPKTSDAAPDDAARPGHGEPAAHSRMQILDREADAQDAPRDDTREVEGAAVDDAATASESELGVGEEGLTSAAPRKKKPRGRGESVTADR